MTYDQIKIIEKNYRKALNEFEKAKLNYWKNTPSCLRKNCYFYDKHFTNNCSKFSIQEDCVLYLKDQIMLCPFK